MAQPPRHLDTYGPPGQDSPRLPEASAGILREAVDQGATDIHVDTWGNHAVGRASGNG